MADNKRSRRYNSLKEVKRVTIAKNQNRDELVNPVEAPKLLLKSKPKSEYSQMPTQATAISIAVREPSGNVPNKTPIVLQSGSTTTANPGVSNSSDVRLEVKTSATVEQSAMKSKQMTFPLPLINDHLLIDPTPMTFLSESNDNFHVIGVIGTQGTGKSTLLNLLAGDSPNLVNDFFADKDLFDTNRGLENHSCNPTTEGINIFVTAERLILIDSSPVLCNPYKKDVVLNEIDDLKMVSFMLSVCHTVLIVEDEPFNTSLLRLLCCADMMRLSLDKDNKSDKSTPSNSTVHQPQIMFVHNLARQNMFLSSFRDSLNTKYLSCLQNTELRILSGTTLQNRTQSRRSLNTFTFPRVPKKEVPITFNGHSDIPSLVKQFQQQVLFPPRIAFPGANPMTEIHWGLLVNAAWESHKTNYFFRKYESDASSRTLHQ